MLHRNIILIRYTDIVSEGRRKGRNSTCLNGGELGKDIIVGLLLFVESGKEVGLL